MMHGQKNIKKNPILYSCCPHVTFTHEDTSR